MAEKGFHFPSNYGPFTADSGAYFSYSSTNELLWRFQNNTRGYEGFFFFFFFFFFLFFFFFFFSFFLIPFFKIQKLKKGINVRK